MRAPPTHLRPAMASTFAIRRLAVVFALLHAPGVGGAQLATAAAGGYVAIAGSRVYYEECEAEKTASSSAAPVVVLLHDGVMGAATWDAVWPTLCGRYRVLRYDRRGKGRSESPTAQFSHVADLAALLANRGITRATVIGSSAGGAIALDFALAHPGVVERLVLVGPVLGGMPLSAHFQARERANIAPLLERDDVEAAAVLQSEDRYAFSPTSAEARRTMLTYLRQNPQNLRGALTDGRFQERPTLPAAARLSEVQVPTLSLVGEFDTPDVQAHAGAIEYGVWGTRREVVSDAGHLPQLERAAFLSERIAAFVGATPLASVRSERLELLTGQYAPFVRGQPGRVTLLEGRLVAQIPGERDIPLFAADDSTFYTPFGPSLRLTFHRGPDGVATSVDVRIGESSHRAVAARPMR